MAGPDVAFRSVAGWRETRCPPFTIYTPYGEDVGRSATRTLAALRAGPGPPGLAVLQPARCREPGHVRVPAIWSSRPGLRTAGRLRTAGWLRRAALYQSGPGVHRAGPGVQRPGVPGPWAAGPAGAGALAGGLGHDAGGEEAEGRREGIPRLALRLQLHLLRHPEDHQGALRARHRVDGHLGAGLPPLRLQVRRRGRRVRDADHRGPDPDRAHTRRFPHGARVVHGRAPYARGSEGHPRPRRGLKTRNLFPPPSSTAAFLTSTARNPCTCRLGVQEVHSRRSGYEADIHSDGGVTHMAIHRTVAVAYLSWGRGNPHPDRGNTMASRAGKSSHDRNPHSADDR